MSEKKNRNAGIGCVEIILILLMLIILVLVFREQITEAVRLTCGCLLKLTGTKR